MKLYAKKTYRKRARRPRARKPYKRSKTIAKVVKKVLSSTLERKAWFFASANTPVTTAHNDVITSGPNQPYQATWPISNNLIPALVQGTGHSQRIGNEVKVTNAYIKGYVNILPSNTNTNPLPVPVYVKLFLVSYKINNQPNIVSPTTFTSFFDSNNTAVGFQGNMLDIILTPNKDAWTVHSTKTMKLGSGSQATTGAVSSGAYFDNSPMSAPFYFNYTKHIAKLKFDDTVNNLCTNRNLWLLYQVVNADGQTSPYSPVEIHTSSRVEYTDA